MAMVPKCDYEPCGKNGHYAKDCRMKHPHLKKAYEERLESNKGRRANKKDKRAKKEKEEKEAKEKEAKEKKGETYGAVEAYASHPALAAAAFSKLVAAALPSNLPPVGASANTTANATAPDFVMAWLLDTGASYHMTGNRSAFTSFTPMSSRTVGGIGGDLKAGGMVLFGYSEKGTVHSQSTTFSM